MICSAPDCTGRHGGGTLAGLCPAAVERNRQYSRTYYAERKEAFRERFKDYYETNRDYFREREQIKTMKNPQWRKEYKLKGYGLTRQQALELFEASDGLCALCYERPATAIDHDHVTGKVRGALCLRCNTGLGNLGDDIEGLHRAIEYLETVDAV